MVSRSNAPEREDAYKRKVVIAGKKGWTKTHVQWKFVVDSWKYNASSCRNVEMGTADWVRPIKKGERPTCPVCRKCLEVMKLCVTSRRK